SYTQISQGLLILDSVAEVIEQLAATPDRQSDPLEDELIRFYQRGKTYRALRGALNPPSLGAQGQDPLLWVGSPLALVPLENLLDPAAGAEALHPIPAALSAYSPLWRIPGDPALVQQLGDLVTQGIDPLDTTSWPTYGRQIRQLQDSYFDSFDDPLLQNYALRRGAELLLNRGNLWFWAGQLGFVLGILWLLARLPRKPLTWVPTVLRWGSIVAALVALLTLSLMIFVTRRPPVTNLGASLDFVGTLGLVLGAVVSWGGVGRSAVGPASATVSGARPGPTSATAGRSVAADFGSGSGPEPAPGHPGATGPVSAQLLFQPIAFVGAWILISLGSYLGEGTDPLGVLPAVLDTNLWLTVHVLTVVSGYSVVVLAGVLGNILVLGSLFKPGVLYESGSMDLVLRKILVLGLALTFFGTMLGGFWADQAWGRFWGWDPKENGALLIILWTSIVLHLGPAGFFGDFGMALGAGAGLLVVGFSWFGVNLMGEGLHSYGFNTRTLVPLILVGVGQVAILVMGIVGSWVKKSSSNSKKAP
ncbi:MAG: cytochrome c biogenesis protein CcsA, partial [Spirochaetales bacterium]|nr:cytochrome c biogenesis protein CcsA [Spirochaetales bacterium]